MGAEEIFCEGTRRCVDLFSGKPLGFFGCNHVADSQGMHALTPHHTHTPPLRCMYCAACAALHVR